MRLYLYMRLTIAHNTPLKLCVKNAPCSSLDCSFTEQFCLGHGKYCSRWEHWKLYAINQLSQRKGEGTLLGAAATTF
jgi:hypothetical protein